MIVFLCVSNIGDSHVYILGSENADVDDYALVVRCFPKHGMNWAIFTRAKVLRQDIVKEFLTKVEEMGFELKNIIQVPFEKCLF
jgi:lipocalin